MNTSTQRKELSKICESKEISKITEFFEVVEVSEASHPKFAFFESLKTANVVKKHY
jgi:hypothetical protein